MELTLTAVMETGEPRTAAVPYPTNHPLSIPRGAEVVIRVVVLKPNGAPANLLDGTGVLTVKAHSEANSAQVGLRVNAEVDSGSRCLLLFTLTGAQTAGLDARRYVYDVWFTDADGAPWCVVPLSEFTVAPAAFRAP